MQEMYDTWYLPWHEYDTFKVAHHDPAFKDVQRRPKHNHCKCPNCLELELWRKRAFTTQFEVEVYSAAYKAHR